MRRAQRIGLSCALVPGLVASRGLASITFTTFDPPGATGVYDLVASGSNVSGNYSDANQTSYGFYWNGSNLITLDYPQSTSTRVEDMDGSTVVGSYNDASGQSHGFVWTPSSGYQTFDAPQASGSSANGISGQNIVGTWNTSGGDTKSYFWNGSAFTTLAVPNADNTIVFSVSGNLVGGYTDPPPRMIPHSMLV